MNCLLCKSSLVNVDTVLYPITLMAVCGCGHTHKLPYSDFYCLTKDIHTLAFSGVFSDSSKIEPVKRYDCGQCEYATESYRAINNFPTKVHLCRYCYNLVSEDMQTHYKEIGDEPIPDTLRIGSGAISGYVFFGADWGFKL